MSTSARQQGAQGLSSHDAQQALQQHTDSLDPQAQGKYTHDVGGQEAQKAQGRTLTDPVERFSKPLLHLDTPVSASFVTPASISLFSGQDTSLTMQGDAHLTAAHTVSSVSGQTTSLYTHSGGIKGIAANGPLSLRAHTDAMQVHADQNVTIQSTTDEIRVFAKDSITLAAGQCQVLLKGSDITLTMPGQFTVKGAAHPWEGGRGKTSSSPDLPEGQVQAVPCGPVSLVSPEPERYSERLVVWSPLTGECVSTSYALLQGGCVVDKGRTAADGFSPRQLQDDVASIDALIGPSGPWAIDYHRGDERLPLAHDDANDATDSEVNPS